MDCLSFGDVFLQTRQMGRLSRAPEAPASQVWRASARRQYSASTSLMLTREKLVSISAVTLVFVSKVLLTYGLYYGLCLPSYV